MEASGTVFTGRDTCSTTTTPNLDVVRNALFVILHRFNQLLGMVSTAQKRCVGSGIGLFHGPKPDAVHLGHKHLANNSNIFGFGGGGGRIFSPAFGFALEI